MPDISMCNNGACPLRHNCYRYSAIPCPYIQSYSHFEYNMGIEGNITCDAFWSMGELSNETNKEKE